MLFIGYLLNRGIYLFLKHMIKPKYRVLRPGSLLLIFYPIIVTIIAIITGLLFNFISALLLFVSFPLSAWCYSQYKAN
jgi:hypothetical protein